MKVSLPLFLLLLLFGSFSAIAQDAIAQNQETPSPQPRKFYIGVNYTNAQYSLKPKNYNPAYATLNPNFITFPGLHVGYVLGKRTSIQIGVAYAYENWQTGTEYNNSGMIEGNYDAVQTRGGIIPLTFRYNFLDLGKRFQAFGTSSLTAAFGKNTVTHTSTVNNGVTNRYRQEQSALNMYLALGLGLNYKLCDRFDVIGEMLINKNLSSDLKNTKPTFNVGFNYKFKL
jgi:hypothetical protein